MRFLPLLLIAGFAFTGQVPGTDVASFRFSGATIAALERAEDWTVFPLEKNLPLVKYDKVHKKLLVGPVRRWLEAHSRNGKPLPEPSFHALTRLLLDSGNHNEGLFAVSEPVAMAIRFRSAGEAGYIVLHVSSLAVIYWGENSEGTMLNETGAKALRQWISGESGL